VEPTIADVTSSDKEETKEHDVPEKVQSSSNNAAETTTPPFPERLALTKTPEPPAFNLLGELQNLYVKIPLLQALRDVPIYARTMRDICVKKPGRKTKDPLTVHVMGDLSALMSGKTPPVKYGDPGHPTVTVQVGKTIIPRVLVDLGAAINIMTLEMKGISPELCTHRIYIKEDCRPICQPQRRMNPNLREILKEELQKLLNAGFIYPISDSEWVSPLVIVPKKNGKWRVCVDYRALNKATQKDHFPLPFIDQVLDNLSGKKFFSFLDGFSGYNQIKIAPQDQDKTTFTSPWGTFAYRVLPFGLCNAPATFQRAVLGIFLICLMTLWKFLWMTLLLMVFLFRKHWKTLRRYLKDAYKPNFP
jgi:hypothetical protein